jgi:DNA replication protein DnaC
MSNLAYERLHYNLKLMKLNIMDSILDNSLEIAARDGLSTIEILDQLLDQEMKCRQANALQLKNEKGRIPD